MRRLQANQLTFAGTAGCRRRVMPSPDTARPSNANAASERRAGKARGSHTSSHAPGRDAHDRAVPLGRLRADDRVPVPKPIRIGSRAVRWVEQEVLDFIASRPRAGSDRPACAAGMIRDLLDRQRRKPAMSKGEEMLAAGLAALPLDALAAGRARRVPPGCRSARRRLHQRPSSRGLCVPLPDWAPRLRCRAQRGNAKARTARAISPGAPQGRGAGYRISPPVRPPGPFS